MVIFKGDIEILNHEIEILNREIKILEDQVEELKLDSYRYKFVRSTCATTAEQIAGYDKSVDEHIRRRNENLN